MGTPDKPISRSRLVQIGVQLLLVLIACFFVYFGINVLVFAYTLKDPATFVLTFFSSNLIILISLALLAGFIFKIIRLTRPPKEEDHL